jgi:hypothetical protein
VSGCDHRGRAKIRNNDSGSVIEEVQTKVRHSGWIAAASLLIAALPVGGAAQEPTLEQVLSRAGAYVANLHQQLSGIVAEETYVQRSVKNLHVAGRYPIPVVRTLKSDLLLMRRPGAEDYVEFRDVFAVDGKAVRDREERLTKLFLQPSAASTAQMERIVEESARYNLGSIFRSINTPLLTLAFLVPGMQAGMEFRRVTRAQPRVGINLALPDADLSPFTVAAETWTVEFKEKRRPTFIRRKDGGNFAATGRFWIEPAAGAVLVSELVMRDSYGSATIVVSHQSEPLLGFRVPIAMDERYRMQAERIDGVARYGRFRQFQVTTSETVGKPPGR